MIKSVDFVNFKVLSQATLPLSQFTLLIGPNGSGKSTALQALRCAGSPASYAHTSLFSAGAQPDSVVAVQIHWGGGFDGMTVESSWTPTGPPTTSLRGGKPGASSPIPALQNIPIYHLNPRALSSPIQLQPNMVLTDEGTNLAGALDQLRDRDPERFELLNEELCRWIPDFNRVLFETPAPGHRALVLRTRDGASIRAADLSDGTLLALAILAVAYDPDPRPIICFEEPDRGLHPRLLRDVKDALYRLAYPDSHGEKRQPVQVIATTHSPYLLELFKEHPEEIVIAERLRSEARFERLSDRTDVEEILQDASLGEAWYGGVLGGVPIKE